MKPRDFLDVADEWSVGNREAEWRSPISRAYYAAFHAAIELMTACGFVVPHGEQAHGYLWLRLSNSGHPDIIRAGAELKLIRSARNRADYDIRAVVRSDEAVEVVQDAIRVITIIETTHSIPSALSQITIAMREYEQRVLKTVTWKAPSTR